MLIQGPEFDEAVDIFTLYCRSKGLAPRTIQTYLFALKGLRGFLATESVCPQIPSTQDLRGYISDMLERGSARGTIRIRMRSIRCFCNFLVREGIVDVSPMENVEIPRVPFVHPTVLTHEHVEKLLKACNQRAWTGVRNHTMLLTFLDTGVRLGELIRLDIEDVDLREGRIRIREAKNGKERYVFTGTSLRRALRRWLDTRTISVGEGGLFVTRKGEHLKQRNLARIIERLVLKAGLDDIRVTPHILRHTFATHYIKNGGDPFSLQRILGHSDIKTTMIYVNLAGVGLREAHAKASPVDRLLGAWS